MLAASVSAAAAGCAVHQECGSCLDATDDDNDSCFWCYSTRSCQAVNPSITALLEGKTFNGCADYGLDRATCACRPTVYTSCADCARPEHPSCVWMPNGTMTTTIQLALGGAVHSKSFTTPTGGRCMVGTPFGPTGAELGANVSFVNGLGALSAAYVVAPSKWYWAQCKVPSVWTAAGLIALAASVCGGLCCLLRYCGRRRWRRRQVRNDAAREAILVYQPGGWQQSTTTG